MSIQTQIQKDLRDSMKEKNIPVRDLLRVVIGEFNREGKIVSDDRAFKIIKKMSDNAIDQKNEEEIKILEKYLPSQLSESELNNAILSIIVGGEYESMKDMGKVMKDLNDLYKGQFDGKIASKIVKEKLS
jgi:uncharacterized protein YqeY